MAYQYSRIKWIEGMFEDPIDGWVSEHREIASQKIGRSLKDGECVHHMDEDKFNNDPDNLMVFRTNGDHKSYHSQIDFGLIPIILINDDGSYGTITRIQPENYICKCGNKKEHGSLTCLECHNKDKAKNIPPKEELAKIVWEIPTTKIAEHFGVSDKAVSKWCEKYNLTKPPRGYWAKNN